MSADEDQSGIATPHPAATGGAADSPAGDEGPRGDTAAARDDRSARLVVGLGASAGGLAALEQFFSGLDACPAPGMAFVVVQHLAPDHTSLLAELIARRTRLPVAEVVDGTVVRPDCVYIIPPGQDMALLGGSLQLLTPAEPRGHRLPIDFFFRSLAQDQRERAVAIVLSGTGSDGAVGVRAVKAEGGLVMAQTPESSGFDGMPRSAIATGAVDFERAPAAMAAELLAFARGAVRQQPVSPTRAQPPDEAAMRKVFVLLRSQTGHDFSLYKPTTVLRRIERRMALQRLEAIDDYVRLLRQSPPEVDALFRDLLIGVTQFFRDPAAFQVLQTQVVPRLFAARAPQAPLRAWVAGCSTGEEAYSVAMLLREQMAADTDRNTCTVQVFATDIDSRAVAAARAGRYPAGIASDVAPERLARHFTAEPGGWRVSKGLRDLLVFSEQNLVRDPPFSRLDLICCRNVLIYLRGELQQRLIPLFHQALKPGGVLFLGTSESVGEFEGLFRCLDRKAKCYERAADPFIAPRIGVHMPPVTARLPVAAPETSPMSTARKKPTLRELTEQALLQHIGAAAVLVTAQGDILYLHGRTGLYLELAPGDARVSNILRMAREGLYRPLSQALSEAATSRQKAQRAGLRVRTNGHHVLMDLQVVPLAAGAELAPQAPLFLVVLQPSESALPGPAGAAAEPGSVPALLAADASAEARIAALTQSLILSEEQLQATRLELDTSVEDLKSSNEEMQSVNEELQSTNEELETSKEELQSVNEELNTVNTELYAKVADLSRANNDMNNLLAGTGIATVFVDLQLRILRFTPRASELINLIPGDTGRPVGHIVSNLVGYDALVADAQRVLDTLIPREREVMATDGRSHTMRIQPYRTLDNVIEGAVITFVDITPMVKAREALALANRQQRLVAAARDATDAIVVHGLDGATLAWNPAAQRLYGWTEDAALAMNLRDRVPLRLRESALAEMRALLQTGALVTTRTRRLTLSGVDVEIAMTGTGLLNDAGVLYAIAATERPMPPAAGPADPAAKGAL